MSDRQRLGDFGERLARQHLLAQGYQIVTRNFRTREGEIDLIASKDGCLVFIEVRTRRGLAMGSAAESVDSRKQAHLLAVAHAYLQQHPTDGDLRLDVIAVDLTPGGRLIAIQHFEDAFQE